MKPLNIEPGRVVLSKAGRDKGKFFIVLNVLEDGRYAEIADGDLRKITKTKKKKVIHIHAKPDLALDIKIKLQNKSVILDSEIRKYLVKWQKGKKEDQLV